MVQVSCVRWSLALIGTERAGDKGECFLHLHTAGTQIHTAGENPHKLQHMEPNQWQGTTVRSNLLISPSLPNNLMTKH